MLLCSLLSGGLGVFVHPYVLDLYRHKVANRVTVFTDTMGEYTVLVTLRVYVFDEGCLL